eukprot:1012459-Alexandrium_andersonii.AAC.1
MITSLLLLGWLGADGFLLMFASGRTPSRGVVEGQEQAAAQALDNEAPAEERGQGEGDGEGDGHAPARQSLRHP